jgi:hypothetical protein
MSGYNSRCYIIIYVWIVIVFIISDSYSDQSIELNPLALRAGPPVDFLLDSNNATIKAAREFHDMALKSLKYGSSSCNNNNHTIGELATLDQTISGCAWLTVDYVDRAGLGHTLSCWMKYLLDAVENNLTYYSPFYSAAHNNAPFLYESANFFGFHTAYFWGNRFPSNYFRHLTKTSSSAPQHEPTQGSGVRRKNRSPVAEDCALAASWR